MAKRRATPDVLGDLLGGKPSDSKQNPERTAKQKPEQEAEEAPERSRQQGASGEPVAPVQPKTRSGPDNESESATGEAGYERTSTGYRRASGEEVKRCTIFLTPQQRRTLKAKALQAGYDDWSSYIIDRLDL